MELLKFERDFLGLFGVMFDPENETLVREGMQAPERATEGGEVVYRFEDNLCIRVEDFLPNQKNKTVIISVTKDGKCYSIRRDPYQITIDETVFHVTMDINDNSNTMSIFLEHCDRYDQFLSTTFTVKPTDAFEELYSIECGINSISIVNHSGGKERKTSSEISTDNFRKALKARIEERFAADEEIKAFFLKTIPILCDMFANSLEARKKCREEFIDHILYGYGGIPSTINQHDRDNYLYTLGVFEHKPVFDYLYRLLGISYDRESKNFNYGGIEVPYEDGCFYNYNGSACFYLQDGVRINIGEGPQEPYGHRQYTKVTIDGRDYYGNITTTDVLGKNDLSIIVYDPETKLYYGISTRHSIAYNNYFETRVDVYDGSLDKHAQNAVVCSVTGMTRREAGIQQSEIENNSDNYCTALRELINNCFSKNPNMIKFFINLIEPFNKCYEDAQDIPSTYYQKMIWDIGGVLDAAQDSNDKEAKTSADNAQKALQLRQHKGN